jgi:phenylpyruvate tautomerase PptA (4-oxalocrotonate tautomerase family)
VNDGFLTSSQKSQIANDIVDIHCGITSGTPREFVHVIFEEVPEGNSYTGGELSSCSKIIGLFRAGRTPETRAAVIEGIAESWTKITAQEPKDVVVALQEIAPKNTYEWGAFLPDPGEEQEWIDRLEIRHLFT